MLENFRTLLLEFWLRNIIGDGAERTKTDFGLESVSYVLLINSWSVVLAVSKNK